VSDQIGCVVIPTYDYFLKTLIQRKQGFTALIWPGFGQRASRMIGPYNWLTAGPRRGGQHRQPPQLAIPFLYRGISKDRSEPPFVVSHVSLAVYMVHDHIVKVKPQVLTTLDKLRVEVFAGRPWGNDYVRTWYVVTETFELNPVMAYDDLTLISQDRPLDPNFARGYGMVWLPTQHRSWYEGCTDKYASLLAMPNGERWQSL